MTIKQRLHWFAVLVISILALPFLLLAALISLLALGIYYLAKLALMPAFWLYRIVRPRATTEYTRLRNPIITFSDWLLDKADWKGV
jgi:hypothetical protein